MKTQWSRIIYFLFICLFSMGFAFSEKTKRYLSPGDASRALKVVAVGLNPTSTPACQTLTSEQLSAFGANRPLDGVPVSLEPNSEFYKHWMACVKQTLDSVFTANTLTILNSFVESVEVKKIYVDIEAGQAGEVCKSLSEERKMAIVNFAMDYLEMTAGRTQEEKKVLFDEVLRSSEKVCQEGSLSKFIRTVFMVALMRAEFLQN